MGWIKFESFWLGCSDFADVFVWCEAAERHQAAGVIVGCDEVTEMRAQLIVTIVVEPFDRSVFDRAVHPLDLSVRPGVAHLGEPVFDPVLRAPHSKHMC